MQKIIAIISCSIIGFFFPLIIIGILNFAMNIFNIESSLSTISYEKIIPYMFLGVFCGMLGGYYLMKSKRFIKFFKKKK